MLEVNRYDVQVIKQRLDEQKKILDELRSIVLNKTSKPLNVEEAAQYLGVSKGYLYKLTSNHLIAFYKPNGKKIFFKKEELDEWILRNRIKDQDQLERETNER